VARNRKRANQRRTRRPSQAENARRGLPTATEPPFVDEVDVDEVAENGVPDPIGHAAPDVELADAQLAFGRPAELEPDDEADEEELEFEVEESIRAGDGGDGDGGRRGRHGGGDGYDEGGPSGELAVPAPRHVEARENIFARLVGFLQGSWRELQRVQWPDRRQVMQATGVVIGFVIVAAAFLGGADWVSGKLVTFILK
jgi:preprotein translocase subunit SecE